MYYYQFKQHHFIALEPYNDLNPATEEAIKGSDRLYFLFKAPPMTSRRSYCISDPSLLYIESEDIDLLKTTTVTLPNLPKWLTEKIRRRNVIALNTLYPTWQRVLKQDKKEKWRVHLIGPGDVGGTALIGLRLLGGDILSKIGVYARSEETVHRWDYELNQVLSPFNEEAFPEVVGISEDELFDCDMFVFCASKGVPPVGQEEKDVRMIQFEGNSNIMKIYAKKARAKKFKGIFAVVSDPVDLLSKVAFLESNQDEAGHYDFKGLAPEQIRGYGLGVMHARAHYYAKNTPELKHYLKEGRAFGPHGEGLVIADSIENYNDDLSQTLTERAKKANLDVRSTGYKPYIAPALSSGTLSLLATMKGDWHYSATFMGGVFMGANNRLLDHGVELERLALPKTLEKRLQTTYERLGDLL